MAPTFSAVTGCNPPVVQGPFDLYAGSTPGSVAFGPFLERRNGRDPGCLVAPLGIGPIGIKARLTVDEPAPFSGGEWTYLQLVSSGDLYTYPGNTQLSTEATFYGDPMLDRSVAYGKKIFKTGGFGELTDAPSTEVVPDLSPRVCDEQTLLRLG